MTIGEFAERTRLSIKALRIYDELGLLAPADVDPATGYRRYDESQLERARLIAVLRRLDMPLGRIAEVIDVESASAARLLATWWAEVEGLLAERRTLVDYLQARFNREDLPMRTIEVRTIPERKVISISRHLTLTETDAFFQEAFATLRALGTGIEGIAGAPFLVFYGEVSEDGDGPMELSRPVTIDSGADVAVDYAGVELRVEETHEEAYVTLSQAEMSWPAMLPFCDALYTWTKETGREPNGALRQVLIADRRTASASTLVCDLSLPLR